MRLHRRSTTLIGALAFACTFWPAVGHTVLTCKAKITPKTGELTVKATGVGANPRWGTFAGFSPATQGLAFVDEGTCFAAGTANKCHIGATGTLAWSTPPANCTICVTELVAGTPCCARPKGCVQGIRLRDGSFAINDPRFESMEADPSGPLLGFTGVNVRIVNGTGSTFNTNAQGNLIIGYNEGFHARTGSHNLVIGPQHTWTSFGGLLAGFSNTVSAPFGSVSGGYGNTASNSYASVSGGENNTASGFFASVSGGFGNTASGNEASVSGGRQNTASDVAASVSGGLVNTASFFAASVSGGSNNTASGNEASVSGGIGNTASGNYASVSGGSGNTASGGTSSVSGGPALTSSGFGEWHAGQSFGFPTGSEY